MSAPAPFESFAVAGVVLLAATNRPWDLDPALIRAGRFDVKVHVPLPATAARKEILRLHCDGFCLSEDVDFDALAASTHLFSGAELHSICVEAALLSEAHCQGCVMMSHFKEMVRSTCPAMSESLAMRYKHWNSI